MAHETSLRLPGRLVGVIRTDAAAHPPVAGPLQAVSTIATTIPAARAPVAAADQERLQCVLTSLTEAISSLQVHTRQLAHAVEPMAIELALAVATRFLHAKVEAGDFPFAAVIRHALERCETSQNVQVFLHPGDLALLRREGTEEPLAPHLADMALAADPALARGSCKVQAQDRSVRFDLDQRLAALRQHLLDAVAGTDANSGLPADAVSPFGARIPSPLSPTPAATWPNPAENGVGERGRG